MLKVTLTWLGALAILTGVGCGGNGGGGSAPVDASTPRDSATQTGRDAATAADSGGGSSDTCAADDTDAVATVGCNGGFVSGEPTANGPLSACTVGTEEMPSGSCTTPNAGCFGEDETATMGTCEVLCQAATTYVSTGSCPTGFRCFTLAEDYGLCFRDCDATHACPTGYECDPEGSCVPGGEGE